MTVETAVTSILQTGPTPAAKHAVLASGESGVLLLIKGLLTSPLGLAALDANEPFNGSRFGKVMELISSSGAAGAAKELTPFLSSQRDSVREASARAISMLSDDAAVFQTLVTRDDPALIRGVLFALKERIRTGQLPSALHDAAFKFMASDAAGKRRLVGTYPVMTTPARLMARLDPDRAKTVLASPDVLRDGNPKIADAVNVLADLGVQISDDVLRPLLESTDQATVRAALKALESKLGDDAVPTLQPYLDHADPEVRRYVFERLMSRSGVDLFEPTTRQNRDGTVRIILDFHQILGCAGADGFSHSLDTVAASRWPAVIKVLREIGATDSAECLHEVLRAASYGEAGVGGDRLDELYSKYADTGHVHRRLYDWWRQQAH